MKKYWFEDLMMSDGMEKFMLVMAHVGVVVGIVALVVELVKHF